MIVQCEHCRRSYESDTADENCPHTPAHIDARAALEAMRTPQVAPPETIPVFGGTANNTRLPACGDIGSTLEVIVQAQPALTHSMPVEIRREQYELHQTPATGERFYRHLKETTNAMEAQQGKRTPPTQTRHRQGAQRTQARQADKLQPLIFGAANQQRAREAKRRLNR